MIRRFAKVSWLLPLDDGPSRVFGYVISDVDVNGYVLVAVGDTLMKAGNPVAYVSVDQLEEAI